VEQRELRPTTRQVRRPWLAWPCLLNRKAQINSLDIIVSVLSLLCDNSAAANVKRRHLYVSISLTSKPVSGSASAVPAPPESSLSAVITREQSSHCYQSTYPRTLQHYHCESAFDFNLGASTLPSCYQIIPLSSLTDLGRSRLPHPCPKWSTARQPSAF
jgi:hypothetical protein